MSTVTLVLLNRGCLRLYSYSTGVHLDCYMYSNDVMSNAMCNVISTMCTEIML